MPRRRPVRPFARIGAQEPTSTLVSASVSQWIDRVRSNVEHNPQTGLPTVRTRQALDQRDPYAVMGAKWFCESGGTFVDGSSPACQTFWRMWARQVLAEAGVSGFEGLDYEVRLLPFSPEDVRGRSPAMARLVRGIGGKLAVHSESYPPGSAQHWAALLESTCMMLDAAVAERTSDETLFSARAATIVGQLLSDVRAQPLLPLAERGAKALQSTRHAARAKAQKARLESPADAWRQEVEGRRPGISAESVYARIGDREGLRPGSIKKAILRLSKKPSPR